MADSSRLWKPHRLPKDLKEPYVLAHKYREYMKERPIRRGEVANPYYERLLANHEDPPKEADDRLSRAIRYAKEHFECYYEIDHVDKIIMYLDKRGNTPMQPFGTLMEN
ncbi:hypothetical protein N0V90_000930 [Kalmusia sp. IMI 367209]|nr:hypothetical protein N0V90_000930 [Kalmusia sp. IMI 367209]